MLIGFFLTLGIMGWAFVFYGQTVGGLAILGMGLIVVSGTIIALRSPAVEAN